MLDCLFRFLAVGTHLSAGSVDGVEVFFKSCNHVEDDSVAHPVLDVNVLELELANNQMLI